MNTINKWFIIQNSISIGVLDLNQDREWVSLVKGKRIKADE